MKKELIIDIHTIVKEAGQGIAFHDHCITAITRLVHDLNFKPILLVGPVDDSDTISSIQSIFSSEGVSFEVLNISDLAFDAQNPHIILTGVSDQKVESTKDQKTVFDAVNNGWIKITNSLKNSDRKISHQRITKETQISIDLNLDGSGVADISTGLHFFDHMLEQIARHGNIDLSIHAKGDLHIDEHHTIEDTAITLGEAIAKALGDKRGIERYGFCLPMDDALAQVAIDFGGRNWIVWNATFNREKIGDVPTEMFYHFFKSFSDSAKCNLNIHVSGDNEHHKIEAIFKAFAKSIKMAVKRDFDNMQLPSTKGVL